MFSLNGKRAIITGAASGIGFATAQVLASAGAAVAVVDLNKGKAAEAIAAETGAHTWGVVRCIGCR